ncbi:MAG: molybdopterin-dependent oxidoreductase [Chloroflexi bacterium]|nr:molybdopterin-dependent oxidoreductase [Chloroflexota bacterium]
MARQVRVALFAVALVAIVLASGACVVSPGAPPEGAESATAAVAPVAGCTPQAVVVPTAPATVPRYAQLDETTGLHVTGVAPEVADLDVWRLTVDGAVEAPQSLTYDELRCMRRVEAAPLLVCPGFFEDRATWAGVPLGDVLALAGAPSAWARVRLYGADGYTQDLSIEEALAPDVFLAYEWEGEPLPIIHGFPLRAIVPASGGSVWVKWLARIEVY